MFLCLKISPCYSISFFPSVLIIISSLCLPLFIHKNSTKSTHRRLKKEANTFIMSNYIFGTPYMYTFNFLFFYFFFYFFSNNAIFRTWKLISSHRFSRMSSTRFYATEITSWRGRELFLVDRNSVARGSLIRWRYNPKDEHLERSRRGTEGDGFPCIGN